MRLGLLCTLAAVFLGPLAPAARPADPAPAKLTPPDLDRLMAQALAGAPTTGLVSDEQFLRRASLDLIGRQPTPDELLAFCTDRSPDKRAKAVDRLLASPEFGTNWANYWSDAISFRVPPPELTFLNYKPLKAWLADKLNANTPWDAIVRELLTAKGKLQDNPAAIYIGYHQANAAKLAAETARLFLGLQLQCAECHDHKFDHWKREQFHQFAAYFARTEAKLTQKDAAATVVKDKGKGEYEMPNLADPRKNGQVMTPTFLTGAGRLDLNTSDDARRAELARLVTDPTNQWFAKAYTNRIWARLMGRGFYEPVDDLADHHQPMLPTVHQALADHFTATGFDIKDLFRLVMNTAAYQRALPDRPDGRPFTGALAGKLRGDEVFDSLVRAIGLPNKTPPAMKPTAEIRFPPPPKSTRDLVCECFGFDPSLAPAEVTRTMGQAMLLMNNDQIQAQINADPKSGTLLSQLLAREPDDRAAVTRLFLQVLSRRPTDREMTIALDHIKEVGQRGAAFEDLLWSLINSAEFTTRR